jgi:hypothetical protein
MGDLSIFVSFSISFNSLIFCLFYYIIVVQGVHCDIYRSSYNILYLNSPPPSFSFIPPTLTLIPGRVSTCLIFQTLKVLIVEVSPSLPWSNLFLGSFGGYCEWNFFLNNLVIGI